MRFQMCVIGISYKTPFHRAGHIWVLEVSITSNLGPLAVYLNLFHVRWACAFNNLKALRFVAPSQHLGPTDLDTVNTWFSSV